MFISIFVVLYASLQLIIISEILDDFIAKDLTRSWAFFASWFARLINILNLMMGCLSFFLPIRFVFFPHEPVSVFFAACNSYLVIYWIGGVLTHVIRLRRKYYLMDRNPH